MARYVKVRHKNESMNVIERSTYDKCSIVTRLFGITAETPGVGSENIVYLVAKENPNSGIF